jgi:alkyl sulfatase BDS1-like metallo-beta-lactamase superfamily hydrolase
MIDLGAGALVPGHTRPVLGAANVRAALAAYRDGITSIVEQTLAGMRKGERPDELVQHVTLPPALAESPYLQEFYGTVAWSVRAVYADYAGRFDGNPTKLFRCQRRSGRRGSWHWPGPRSRARDGTARDDDKGLPMGC